MKRRRLELPRPWYKVVRASSCCRVSRAPPPSLKRLTHVYFALFPSMPIAAPLDSSRTRWSPTPYYVNATTPVNLDFAEEASEVHQEQSFGGALRESIGTGNTPVGKPYPVPGDVTCRGGATPASSIGKPRPGVFVSVLLPFLAPSQHTTATSNRIFSQCNERRTGGRASREQPLREWRQLWGRRRCLLDCLSRILQPRWLGA
jgi:hypothetical protein